MCRADPTHRPPVRDGLAMGRVADGDPNIRTNERDSGMKLSELPPKEQARAWAATCVHEAGHAVVAALHGVRITAVEVTPDNHDHAGLTTYTGTLTASADAAVTYAGPYAEARHLYGEHPSLREIRSVLDGSCDHDGLVASGAPLPRDAERLLSTAWPAVVTVARHLNDHRTADHAVVCAALGIPEVDGHLSAQASAIRAGFPPSPTR